MSKKRKSSAKDSDAVSAEWWEKRRADIRAEIAKGGLMQTVTVMLGRSGAPGHFTLEAYHNDFPMPLAIIWFGFVALDGIQINNIYTFEPVRRCGLMTLLQSTLLSWYPSRNLVTGAGTESGRPWMLSNGWKKTAAGWEYRRKPKGPR